MVRENAIRFSSLLAMIVSAMGIANGQSPSDYFPQYAGNHWKYYNNQDTTNPNDARWTFIDITNDTTFGINGETISYEGRWSECVFGHQDTNTYMIAYFTFTDAGHLAGSAIQIPGDSIVICDPLWIRLENPLIVGDSTIYGNEIFGVVTKILSTNDTIAIDLGTYHNCLKISEKYTVNGALREEDINCYIPLSYFPIAGLGSQTVMYHYSEDSIRVSQLELVECDILPTDVASDDSRFPISYRVTQNYPNPFNPATTIEYSTPTRAQVTIRIYSILGQAVRTLVNETKSAGSYRVEWNGDDDSGKPVSTGVYLYRVQAGDVVQTKKMVLLK